MVTAGFSSRLPEEAQLFIKNESKSKTAMVRARIICQKCRGTSWSRPPGSKAYNELRKVMSWFFCVVERLR